MSNKDGLDEIYLEMLDKDIIEYMSLRLRIDCADAMDLYYSDSLSEDIHDGKFGIQYLDYKLLAEEIIDKID